MKEEVDGLRENMLDRSFTTGFSGGRIGRYIGVSRLLPGRSVICYSRNEASDVECRTGAGSDHSQAYLRTSVVFRDIS